jgi:hypothetical protein
MKRFKVIGLCLVAVFALSAVLAAGASAAAPEFFTCLKAPTKGTGNYSAKNCEAASKVAGTGNYERGAWNAGKKVTFKGKGSNPRNNSLNPFGPAQKPGENAQIEGTTECKKEKLEGKMTGPKTSEWQTEYSSCEAGGFKCLSKTLKSGHIKTDVLNSTLVFLDSAKTNVGILVTGTHLPVGGLSATPRLAQYACGPKEAPEAVNIEVFGSVLAEVNGNTEKTEKKTLNGVAEGAKKFQGIGGTYVEEAPFGPFSEEAAKGWWEYEEAKLACELGKEPFGKIPPAGPKSPAECEAILGGPNPVPVKPDVLESVVSGAQEALAPDNQNGVTENKGEAIGVTL